MDDAWSCEEQACLFGSLQGCGNHAVVKKKKDVQKHGTSLQKVTAAKMYLLQILPPSPVSPTPPKKTPKLNPAGKRIRG